MLREKNNIKKHTHDTRVKLKRLKEVHMTKTHTEASSGLHKDTCGHMSEKVFPKTTRDARPSPSLISRQTLEESLSINR